MKTQNFVIDLNQIELGHSVRVATHGLASQRKYQRDIERLIKKLADRDLEAVCSHQPIQVSRQNGELRIQDSQGRNLFGRARKLHRGTRKHNGRGNK